MFGDDRPIGEEHLTIVHALARFRQIATLRFMTLGLLAMGFALLSWGLWFNLWLLGHFQIRATDRALLLALVALPALCTTPFVGRLTGRLFRRAPRRTIWLSARAAPRLRPRHRGVVDAHRRDHRRLRARWRSRA